MTVQTVQRHDEASTEVPLRSGIDGSLTNMPWIQAMIARGYGRHVTIGTLSTPIVGGGGTDVVLIQQPEFVIEVPLRTTVVPFRIHIQLEPPLMAADDEETDIVIAIAVGEDTNAGIANNVTEVVWNLRTDGATGSNSRVRSAIVSNLGSAPTLDIELAHSHQIAEFAGVPANALWASHSLLYEPTNPPFVVGTSTIIGYWGGTVATSGYAEIQFLEFPTAKISDLI